MEQTVYIDLLFLVNFSMDFLCLFLTAKLHSRHPLGWRTVASATVGGLYSALRLLYLPSGISGFCLDILCSLFLVRICFRGEGIRRKSFWVLFVSFFVISMLLGGIMTSLFSLLNRLAPPAETLSLDDDMPLWIFLLVGIVSFFMTAFGGKYLRRKSMQTEAAITLVFEGKSTCFWALCDTGHFVKDPFAGKQIIIADFAVADRILPRDCRPPSTWNAENIDTLPPQIQKRLTLIPAFTVGSEGLLFTLRPDQAFLSQNGQKIPVDILIGFSELHGQPGDCQGLFPPSLLP